jgi:predicted dehydrogenase
VKKSPVRYAVAGLGHIAQTSVLPAFKNCKGSILKALVSTDSKKLELLGHKYRLEKTCCYNNYDECLRSGKIDAIYIALPNYLHKEYTIKAAESGIHVLCEKPMAVSALDCEEMIDACDKHNVKLMVAYRLHFEAANLNAINLIHHSKKIGDPRIFQSIHSQATNFPNVRTLPIEHGGGPTYDIGIYDINAARYIFQDEPLSVSAECARIDKPEFQHIEESMAVILKFPNERLASIIYSFGAVATDSFRVIGSKGELSLDPAYTYKGGKKLRLSIGGSKNRETYFKPRDQFSSEIDYFSNCVRENLVPEPSGLEGLADIKIIEAIYLSAETKKSIDLSPILKEIRPQRGQEIDRPAPSLPKTFHAEKPTKKKAA